MNAPMYSYGQNLKRKIHKLPILDNNTHWSSSPFFIWYILILAQQLWFIFDILFVCNVQPIATDTWVCICVYFYWYPSGFCGTHSIEHTSGAWKRNMRVYKHDITRRFTFTFYISKTNQNGNLKICYCK